MGFPCTSIFSQRKEIRSLLTLHALLFTLAVLGYYAHYYNGLNGIIDKDGNPLGRDFIAFWTTVTLLKSGNMQNIYSLSAFSQVMRDLIGHMIAGLDFRYPPLFLFFLWPLKYINDYRSAYGIWSLMNIAIFTFAVFWRLQAEKTWQWIVLSAPAVLINVFVGQTGLLTAAFFIGGVRLLGVAPFWAGVVFALLSFKPQFFVFIPLMLVTLRQWKALAGLGAMLCLLFAATACVFGWQIWPVFIANTLAIQSHFAEAHIGKMITVFPNAMLVGMPATSAMGLQLFVSALVTVLALFRLHSEKTMHWSDVLILVTPAIYLISPYGFVYDMPALAAAWVLWLARQNKPELNPFQSFVWLLLWYMPLFSHLLFDAKLPLVPFLLILVFAVELRRIRADQHAI